MVPRGAPRATPLYLGARFIGPAISWGMVRPEGDLAALAEAETGAAPVCIVSAAACAGAWPELATAWPSSRML
jgi:hypothetical protein